MTIAFMLLGLAFILAAAWASGLKDRRKSLTFAILFIAVGYVFLSIPGWFQ